MYRLYGSRLHLLAIGALFFFLCGQLDDPSVTPFEINPANDSVIDVRDTLYFNIITEGAVNNEVTYFWMRDDSWNVDTVPSSHYSAVWQFPDTGTHKLMVYAVDSHGRISNRDTISILVRCFIPQVRLEGDTMALVSDTAAYEAIASDSDGEVDHLIFSTADGKRNFRLSGSKATEHILWTKEDTGKQILFVHAVDNDGLKSAIDSLIVHVALSLPHISLVTGDTSVSINDTGTYLCSAVEADGEISAYEWTVATGIPGRVTVGTDTLRWQWRLPDTGLHTIWVRAFDANGLISPTDSIVVRVFASAPDVTIHGTDDAVAGDSTRFTVTAHDNDGTVGQYFWTVNSHTLDTMIVTSDSSLTISWGIHDTGKHTVRVLAIDDDSLPSAPSCCSLIVRNIIPILLPFPDTIVSSRDTLTVRCTLSDSSISVIGYYWDLDGDGWDDSTTTSVYRVPYSGKKTQTIVAGIQTSLSLMAFDTIRIIFDTPPAITSLSLNDGDTVWIAENGLPGTLPLYLTVNDADNDRCSRYIIWGRGGVDDTIFCTDSTLLPLDSTGFYSWSLHVADSFGHTIVKSGGTHVGREHTICFAGHSIVAGVGDTTYGGGFRPFVLASLRDSLGNYERIRAKGPLTTDFMPWNTVDDSCFAISGSMAREMLLLMDYAYPNLTADIWVLMLGVNGSFNGAEWTATADLIKRMFSRNPKVRVYVLTSQPYVKVSETYRYYYNRSIRDTVAVLSEQGFSGFMVETGDSILSIGTTFNDTLAFDDVHPNIEGYRRMAAGILKVMWNGNRW